jgi:hypothetical protein
MITLYDQCKEKTVQQIIDFIDRNIDGRTAHTKELIYSLENGSIEGVYSDQISFSNLRHSNSAFDFDMFIVSNEKLYVLGENKERLKLRKDFSSVSLFRFELAKRKSTGDITGFFRFVSASGKDVPAQAIVSAIYDVSLNEDRLKFKEEQALYRDQPKEQGFKPVAFQAEHTFFTENGKLHYEYNGRSFDVDPETMQRKASADSFPPFISVER